MLSYDRFKDYILGEMGTQGIKSKVFFDTENDAEGHSVRYTAHIPDENVLFIARPRGLSMTVRFGSGHQAMSRIPAELIA